MRLGGRIHSYVDMQITRLGGPNFHEIPIETFARPEVHLLPGNDIIAFQIIALK